MVLRSPLQLSTSCYQDQFKQAMIKLCSSNITGKNINWCKAEQFAIYKRSQEVELRASENNIGYRSEQDLNLWATDSNPTL